MDKAQALIQAVGSLRTAPQTGATLMAMAAAGDHARRTAEEAAQLVNTSVASAAKYACDRPVATGVVVTGVLLAVAPGVATVPVLNAAGFGGNGVVAGSFAAGLQSTIGNVVAGSGFATLQSAGVGGAGLAAVNGVTQLAGAGVAAVAAVVKAKR